METNLSDFSSEWIEISAVPRARRGLAAPAWQALGYLLALTVAEVFTTLIDPRVGLVLHGAVLVALICHASLTLGRLQGGFLMALAFASLIRLLSLSTPLPFFPKVYWYMVIGAPLLLAAILAVRVSRLNRSMIGIRLAWRGLPVQILVGLSGLGLGFLEYLILRPEPLAERLSFEEILIPALILLVFTGFLEEYIFRGLMQYTATRGLGRFGLLYVPIVFAVLHIGYKSLLDFVFVFIVAVYFGYIVARTGSLVGVALSHGLTNISLFLVFPFLAAQLVPGLGAGALPQATATRPKATAAAPLATATLPQATATVLQPTPIPALIETQAPPGTSTPTETASSSLSATPAAPSRTPSAAPATTSAEISPPGSPSATPAPTRATYPPTALPASQTPVTPGPSPTASPFPSRAPTSSPAPSASPSPVREATPTPSPTALPPAATAPADATPDSSYLVDDGDPGFTAAGPFQPSAQGMFGDMLYARAARQEAGSVAEWRYPSETCGRYEIEVYIPPLPGAAQAATRFALYQIGYRSGMASRMVDQSAYPGKWISLGDWEFLPAAGSFLRLTNATGEDPVPGLVVLFDTARWRFIGPCE